MSEKNKKNSDEDIVCYNGVSPHDKKSRPKVQRNKKRIIMNIIGITVSILLILSGTGITAAYATLNRINYVEIDNSSSESSQDESQTSEESEASSSESTSLYVGDLLDDPLVLNIMLFGADARSDDENGRSDTMILLSIDTRHQKLKMLSFLRDTYVAVPNYGNTRLGNAYAYGGAELAIQTIQNNFGIKIDRYAIVDFDSFTSIIDTLGGIDIELTSEEIDYINWQSWKNGQVTTRYELDVDDYSFYEDEDGDYVALVHLNGRQALWHARNRGQTGICSGDDFVRSQRQRAVLDVVLDGLKNSDLTTILSILYQIGPMITTNLKTSEITTLAADVLTYLNYEVESANLPDKSTLGTDFVYDDVYDMWGNTMNCIVIQDWDDFRLQVARFIYEDSVVTDDETDLSEAS